MKSLTKNKYTLLLFVFLIFVGLRLPAIHFPYHQDEYKWPLYSKPEVYAPGSVPHPPLTEYVFKLTNTFFGENNYRYTPFLFSVANLVLLYFFVKWRYGTKVAFISIIFFSVSFYSILASLTVDTDGAILPFFFLSSLIFYDLFLNATGNKKYLFGSLLFLCLLIGTMVKLSLVLGAGAIAVDFIWGNRKNLNNKKIVYIFIALMGFIISLVAFLVVAKYIFNGFSLSRGISYWETFMRGFTSRNFFQTAIQTIKAALYLSPFFVLTGLLSLIYRKPEYRLFNIFIGIGLFFYVVLFDFSIGALDRYFAFLILPLCVISALFVEEKLKNINKLDWEYLWPTSIIVFVISISQSLPHQIPSLYPKMEWIGRILSLKWNFLYPFSGGSGPTGFYISFMFIGLMWLFSLILTILYIYLPLKRQSILLCLIFVGLVYNFNFTQEYLFGVRNGSSPNLINSASAYINNHQEVDRVLVYNDNGGYNIRQMGKYERRLYAVPGFEPTYEPIFKSYKGYLLYIDIPQVMKGTIYEKYINSCKAVYTEKDKYITSTLYKCNI